MRRLTYRSSSACLADEWNLNLIILSQAVQDDEMALMKNDLNVIQRDIEKEVEFFSKTRIGPSLRPLSEDDIIIDKVSSDMVTVTWS